MNNTPTKSIFNLTIHHVKQFWSAIYYQKHINGEESEDMHPLLTFWLDSLFSCTTEANIYQHRPHHVFHAVEYKWPGGQVIEHDEKHEKATRNLIAFFRECAEVLETALEERIAKTQSKQ